MDDQRVPGWALAARLTTLVAAVYPEHTLRPRSADEPQFDFSGSDEEWLPPMDWPTPGKDWQWPEARR